MDEQEIETVKRRPRLRRWRVPLAILLILLVACLFTLWTMRVRLATSYVDRELARRGVQASYEVRRIGFGAQVLENLVIGDPRRRTEAEQHTVGATVDFDAVGANLGPLDKFLADVLATPAFQIQDEPIGMRVSYGEI